MRKPLVASIFLVLTLLMLGFCTPAYSQDTAKDNTPTFYRLVPGTYVNGWPRFIINYPKEWVEVAPMPQMLEALKVCGPRGVGPAGCLSVSVSPLTEPLEMYANSTARGLRNIATEVTIIRDSPSQLRDLTPAREVEISMILNGSPVSLFCLVTKKDDTVIGTYVVSGEIGDDLKAILYSIEFQPDKDEPVELPPDVQEFLERTGNDILSHDVAKVMANYSDRFLHSGTRKADVEQDLKRWIGTVTSLTGATTDFVREGERAYLAGYTAFNFGTYPNPQISIIKENGQWKWYGNQRDPAP